jgi:hypothetical protein
MKNKLHYFYFLPLALAFWVMSPNASYSQSCKINKIEEKDFKVKDQKQVDKIIEMIKSQNNPDDFDYSANADILKADINNDGTEEYVVASWEGTGHYLNWCVYSLDGKKVPESFWGMDNTLTGKFFDMGFGPSTEIWVATVCGKNYFGYSDQDDSKQLYLIDKSISKACTPEWIDYYKNRDVTEQWSSFCGVSFSHFDHHKKRDDLIGYYSVSDACLYADGNDENGPLLDAGRSEIIIRPYQAKDLSVTIIIGGFWSSSKWPVQTTRTGIATYDPDHGYALKINYPDMKEEPETIYLVPEKNKLVLEAITPGSISNSSWDYSLRKAIPDQCK